MGQANSGSLSREKVGVLFVIGSGVQLDSARRVAVELTRPAQVLNIWTSDVSDVDSVELPGHLAPVTWARLRDVGKAAAQWAGQHKRGIVVAPQDVGLVYRRAIAKARAKGALIALLPDGAVSAQKVTGRNLLKGLVPLADTVLRGVGFVAGRHGEMGASAPDVALSWGPAWNTVFERRCAKRIVSVGNPRSDSLANLMEPSAGNVLICSQPMDHAVIGGAAAAKVWYSFVEDIALSAPPGQLKIRLHPAEAEKSESLPIGERSRTLLTSGTSLSEDLQWAGAVVSWASTTMLEAAAARRTVISLAVNEAAAQLARGYDFQRDPRVLSALTGSIPDFAALTVLIEQAAHQQKDLAEDYSVNVGSAAKAVAAELDAL